MRLQQTPEVWQFEATPAPGLLEQGRKKYERLLRVHSEQTAASYYHRETPVSNYSTAALAH